MSGAFFDWLRDLWYRNVDPEWRDILKRAWSVRLLALAAVLTGAEAVLPFLHGVVPPGVFSVLTFGVVSLAFAARFIVQRKRRDRP